MLLSLVLPALLYGFFEAEISFCFFCSKSPPGVRGQLVTWLTYSLLVVNLDVRWLASSPLGWRSWKALEEKFVVSEKTPSPPSSKKTSQGAANSEEQACKWRGLLSNMTLDHTKERRTDRLSSLGHRTNGVTIGWVETLQSPTPPGSVHGLHVICPCAFACVHALVDTHRQKQK